MRLFVIWNLSFEKEYPTDHDIILSFCGPEDEQEIALLYPHVKLIIGRELCSKNQSEVVAIYQSLLTDISLIKVGDNETLRKYFRSTVSDSYWWFTSLSFRDIENTTIFKNLLYICVIDRVLSSEYVQSLYFVGADPIITSVFKAKKDSSNTERDVQGISAKSIVAFFKLVVFQFLGRSFLLFTFLKDWVNIKLFYGESRIPRTSKVGLMAFYDWSFSLDDELEIEKDNYFKALPSHLTEAGLDYTYLCWYHPNTVPKKKYSERALLRKLSHNNQFHLINKYLPITFILREYFQFWPQLLNLINVFKVVRKNDLFNKWNVNLWPVFEEEFIKSSISSNIMHFQCISVAFSKYFAVNRNLTTYVSFLEHFPFTRAVSNAVRNNKISKINVFAMQHASYSAGKTFYFMDKDHEFRESPVDLLRQPHPDALFVMGNLNKKLFESTGYKASSVLLTGSTRYEYINYSQSHFKSYNSGQFNILIPLTINFETQLDLIQAVFYATQDLLNIRLIIRNHPFWRIETLPWFENRMHLFKFSDQSLVQDFSDSHLIISSYSTVAEEGIFFGIPVIQWASLNFEGSPLANDERIISKTSVKELKFQVVKIMESYNEYLPDMNYKNGIYADYFSPSFNASNNIVEYLKINV